MVHRLSFCPLVCYSFIHVYTKNSKVIPKILQQSLQRYQKIEINLIAHWAAQSPFCLQIIFLLVSTLCKRQMTLWASLLQVKLSNVSVFGLAVHWRHSLCPWRAALKQSLRVSLHLAPLSPLSFQAQPVNKPHQSTSTHLCPGCLPALKWQLSLTILFCNYHRELNTFSISILIRENRSEWVNPACGSSVMLLVS